MCRLPPHEFQDTLCFCLAVLELIIETALRRYAPTAPGLLRWYCRHYLEGPEPSVPACSLPFSAMSFSTKWSREPR